MITQQDRSFSRLAIKNGFMTREQVKRCFKILKQSKDSGEQDIRFEDLAVEQGYLSNEQATAVSVAFQRLRKDLDKKRWSIRGYEIYHKIGQGGLGVVFKAKQVSMNRLVALKILHKRWLNDEEFKQRFLVEARLVGKLSHQNLIKVYDVGREDWKLYFSMEFIDGETLEDVIEREGPIETLRAVEYTLQMLRAIRYLKQFDIVHCDIKPSNILLTQDGVCKLGDFGFVKSNIEIDVTETGSVLGTPDYISPEQAMGQKNLDFRADVYSLGVTLYHMVAKKPPFDGTVSTIMRKHIREKPPSPREFNPDVPESLCKVIERMTAKKPDDRYSTVEEAFEEIEKVKLREKTGKNIELQPRELMTVLEMEKDKSRRRQVEKLELARKLGRMTSLFWVACALFGVSCAIMVYLIYLLRAR